jgi:O-antigen/teichoic acid export membrane protein
MLSKNTTFTIGSKFLILLSGFALVVTSTHIWGSEGRGVIALVLANVSIIAIFNNIFCGSTIAYHASRIKRDTLIFISLAGALIVSLAGAILFSVIFGFIYFRPLFFISLLLSLNSAIAIYWLGNKNIRNYNLLSILSPFAILVSLLVFYFIFNNSELETYYQAYYTGAGISLIIGITGIVLNKPIRMPEFNFTEFKSIVGYGINNEFSYLIQFLNYRLAYYFIAMFLGLAELGIFSIVIAVSEAVWIISRSMSTIHFSNVINSNDQLKNRSETNTFALQSLWISLLVIAVSVLVPRSVFQFIFGGEFGDVKKLIIMLIPGMIAISVSNLYGHYFAGTGNMKILRNKSLIGLTATLILLPPLMYKYQLPGVCVSLNVSYIVSSFYLWYKFKKGTP